MENRKVGIIGVGLMGHGIAANIQKKGWQIGFLDHPGNQPTEHLVANGAIVYQSGKELASESDIIIICVTGSPQVEDVLLSESGVLEGIRPGTIVIDCSTAIPTSTLKLAQAVKNKAAHFLDAPMTRTPKEAAEGRLNLIVGGDKSLFDQTLPLFQAYAENITYAGGVGSGHTMKLLHNFVSIGFSSILAEAVACSSLSKIDPNVLHEVLSKGGGAGVVLDRMTPFILNKDSSGFVFTLANCAKDVGYYTQMCRDLDANDTISSAVSSLLNQQIEDGHADKYVPELIDVLTQK